MPKNVAPFDIAQFHASRTRLHFDAARFALPSWVDDDKVRDDFAWEIVRWLVIHYEANGPAGMRRLVTSDSARMVWLAERGLGASNHQRRSLTAAVAAAAAAMARGVDDAALAYVPWRTA